MFKSPLQDFQTEVQAAGLTDRVTYLAHGETYDFEVPASRWRAPDQPAASPTDAPDTPRARER